MSFKKTFDSWWNIFNDIHSLTYMALVFKITKNICNDFNCIKVYCGLLDEMIYFCKISSISCMIFLQIIKLQLIDIFN